MDEIAAVLPVLLPMADRDKGAPCGTFAAPVGVPMSQLILMPTVPLGGVLKWVMQAYV